MRIIGGKNKRRAIKPPANFKIRPTTDFAKENLFNVLANYFNFEEIEVLDLFSGTGSISYEFCSRGAVRVVSVELNPLHQRFIMRVIEELKYSELHSIRANVFVYLRTAKGEFDIIFADPPYDMDGIDQLPDKILEKNLLKERGLMIIEHSSANNFQQHPNFCELRKYGSVHFSIFNLSPNAAASPSENK